LKAAEETSTRLAREKESLQKKVEKLEKKLAQAKEAKLEAEKDIKAQAFLLALLGIVFAPC
jgi:hypothetical protein